MLYEGQQVELTIEKPASGGRMIARHLGQVILVRGAIPGERVTAWIERAEKQLAYAVTRDVIESSPDRVAAHPDPLCGGLLYAHIAYERQRGLKADLIRDAFGRIGRHPIERPFDVMASRTEGYRMRARLHVVGARAGFYREGSHQLCDAAVTRQLSAAALEAVESLARGLDRTAPGVVSSISISENLAGDRRAVHLDLAAGASLSLEDLDAARAEAQLTGITVRGGLSTEVLRTGDPVVQDSLRDLTQERAAKGTLGRQAESFFQGNRYLVPALVTTVLDAVPPDDSVIDLYAGVGLFSVALAASGHTGVITVVEGDRVAGADLKANAGPYPVLRPTVTSVETFLASVRDARPRTLVVDPPRTGLSKAAGDAISTLGASRIVYVSCDPPTLARDARKLLDGGYAIESIRGFDLFPNTPHVEAVVVFRK
jgi:23S rRNA (uracil1939-C5)-methyltransferase